MTTLASMRSDANPQIDRAIRRVALAGNPNAGKTSLFNQLTGLRAKTANFPGTTIECRSATVSVGGQRVQLLDLPGLYGLNATTAEQRIARDALLDQSEPTGAVIVIDASNLQRNLYLASQIIELGIPSVVVLTMVDLAKRAGIKIDVALLERELGAPVVAVSGRTGKGIEGLRRHIERLVSGGGQAVAPQSMTASTRCSGCPHGVRFDWAEQVSEQCMTWDGGTRSGAWTSRLDRVLTHPVVGIVAFFAVMAAVFVLIFWLAAYPMDWIDAMFGQAQAWVARLLPPGDLQSLVAEGIIGGVGGVLVFLPQICILFFFLALLEDTGYLARAAFVMDRLMRRVGLPGNAFVPLLSAHACAIPGIMATRVIQDRRDRLVTILVLPLMTCSARLPVYAMVTALLFPHQPLQAGLVFTAAYALGITAAIGAAFAIRRTILSGKPRPLVLELPSYKLPRLRNALLATLDRGRLFVRTAGTIILVMSVILWAMATYPRSAAPAEAVAMQQQAEVLAEAGDLAGADAARHDAAVLTNHHALSNSVAGRIGRAMRPVLRPLGFDWQIGVGLVSSLAAREVIVSTLAIIYGVGEGAAADQPESLYDTMRAAKRTDGTPVFTTATCLSLLVFYVLAMQCLPTQAVVRRETNSWKWPIFQFTYMTMLAYVAAMLTYQIASHWPG